MRHKTNQSYPICTYYHTKYTQLNLNHLLTPNLAVHRIGMHSSVTISQSLIIAIDLTIQVFLFASVQKFKNSKICIEYGRAIAFVLRDHIRDRLAGKVPNAASTIETALLLKSLSTFLECYRSQRPATNSEQNYTWRARRELAEVQ